MTASSSTEGRHRRVALIANTSLYIGAPLAREMARRGHDLVIGDPEQGLVDELEALGATVAVAERVWDVADPDVAERLVGTGLDRFGRIDAATAFTGHIVTGRFLESTTDDLHTLERGLIDAPYQFMKAVLPSMIEQGEGQILMITSSAGNRVLPSAPLYSALRAGATHLVKNVAADVASKGVQVNALGTNFMDFDGFIAANKADTPEGLAKTVARVPMGRLGTVDECAALCCAYLDGTCGFVTGQFIAHRRKSNPKRTCRRPRRPACRSPTVCGCWRHRATHSRSRPPKAWSWSTPGRAARRPTR